MNSLRSFANRWLAIAQSTNARETRRSIFLAALVLTLWLIGVILTATQHEFWRDEVRAWSIARAATTPLDLYALTRDEGHPLLWYVLLFLGKTIADVPLVLPITSIAIAFAAVMLFVFCAPFQFWLKVFFIFGATAFYEYSVMARNYGISMLLLFLIATLWKKRGTHPFWLAAALALLANTNAHSAPLTALLAGVWVWDDVIAQKSAPLGARIALLALPVAIAITGIIFCILTTLPTENTLVTSIHHATISDIGLGVLDAALNPSKTFFEILPADLPPMLVALFIYCAALGLMPRPILFLAAFGSIITLGAFFRLVYIGVYRHQALYLMFTISLYWILLESPARALLSRWQNRIVHLGLYGAMFLILLGNIIQARDFVLSDIKFARTSAKSFGEFLKYSDAYRNAIIVPEPDYLFESLPYYAPNRIYLPREHRFGTTISFTNRSDAQLSLRDVLQDARELESRFGAPVLIVIGHKDFGLADSADFQYSLRRTFGWDAEQFHEFFAATKIVIEFSGALTDENYRVYALR